MSQAEDRAHRIGQKACVNVYYLLAEGTIEMEIAGLLDQRRKVLDAVLDGAETEDSALLSELLKKLKG
jgi:SNF2 family DNA or RNA helicase